MVAPAIPAPTPNDTAKTRTPMVARPAMTVAINITACVIPRTMPSLTGEDMRLLSHAHFRKEGERYQGQVTGHGRHHGAQATGGLVRYMRHKPAEHIGNTCRHCFAAGTRHVAGD